MSFDSKEYAVALDEFLVNMEKKTDYVYSDLQEITGRICRILRIASLQVYFYKKDEDKKTGEMETIYQEGDRADEFYTHQIDPIEKGNVVEYIAYRKKDDEAWSDIEKQKVEILVKMMRVFIERMRSRELAEALWLHDMETGGTAVTDGYDRAALLENLKSFKEMEHVFYEGIEKEEFQVYYQPKVLLRDYKLTGAEALCRWVRDGRVIPPGQFIPALEQSKDICVLDFYMLEHVCQDIRRWLDEGRKIVKVSVNLSRCHLGNPDLLQNILSIVDKYYVPHEYIEIELTETTTDVNFHELKDIVEGLHRHGISTSVDDFGMGYSSLNLIRQLPWNVIKIDRSFLKDDEVTLTKNYTMLKYVIALVQDLGMECIVEGVETAEHVKMLKENNCYLAQGFYFDRPLPKAEFEKRLMERQMI